MSRPHLSVVATSRNDGHGGDLVHRMQLFVDGLADQAARHGVATELVMVEWNPPGDRAPLADVLSWPDADGHLRSRLVTVPPEVHARFDPDGVLPMFQMIAKNVGIRRANGAFALATNIDILLSEPLAALLAGPLETSTLYRTDRVDIDVPPDADLAEARAATHGEPVRIVRKDGIYVPGRGRILPTYQSLPDYVACQLRSRWGGGGAPARGPEQRRTGSRWDQVRDRAAALQALLQVPRVFGNACGDFTLLDRASWDELRGYPEWPMFSWNLDTVLLYQAHAHGLAFHDLPAELPAFHMDHETGSGWTPDGRDALFERIDARGISYLRDSDLRNLALEAERDRRRRRPPVYNDERWGLVDVDLPDVEVSGRSASADEGG